jgi:uncharacterized LabA/DUF88 family protein
MTCLLEFEGQATGQVRRGAPVSKKRKFQPVPSIAPREVPRPAAPPEVRTACYVDFENLLYDCHQKQRNFSVSKAARSLVRLSRELCGEGFAYTAVYANWDQVSTTARFAQNDWAQVGWRTVAVPSREDRVSQKMVKNLVDFVMSLDLLEDARDRDFDHFFVVSGDADFCEVVERLKRRGKKVSVVCLRGSLSYRLSEAANQVVLWELEDISGEDSFPLVSGRSAPRSARVQAARPSEDPFDVLRRAVDQAEAELGSRPVDWETVRDEYYLPMTSCDRNEADLFVRQLAEVGYVSLVARKDRSGRLRHSLQVMLR